MREEGGGRLPSAPSPPTRHPFLVICCWYFTICNKEGKGAHAGIFAIFDTTSGQMWDKGSAAAFTEDWRLQSRPGSIGICIWLISFRVPCGWAVLQRGRERLPHYHYHNREINLRDMLLYIYALNQPVHSAAPHGAKQTRRIICKRV